MQLDEYDAGLLPSPGGASDEWWQDTMRAELGRAHEFYQDQVEGCTPPETEEQRKARFKAASDRVLADIASRSGRAPPG